MSRVLFLTPQLPHPPHQGAAIRNLNLIKLAAERHEVSVCSFIRHPGERAAIPVLSRWAPQIRTARAPRRGLLERALWTAFSPEPDMARRLRSAEFRKLVDHADIVQAEGIEMAQYLAGSAARRVFDCHNAEWVLQRRTCLVDLNEQKPVGAAYSALQWLKLRRYERIASQTSDAVITVSEEDRQALLNLDPRLRVDVLPNGVDASFFYPVGESNSHGNVLFTGTLDFRPNVDAVRWLTGQVWPLVRQLAPQATLTIAGRSPIPAIRRLHGSNGISVAASPPDIRPYFAAASVYVVPVRSGGGSRYKLLQAMSCALGIVSTTVGAEGIVVRDGEQLRLADTAADFAEATVGLLRSAEERRRLGRLARELVLSAYDWPILGPRLWALYDRLVTGVPA